MAIPLRSVVKKKGSGDIGIVVPDLGGVCGDEVPVVFEGSAYYIGVEEEDLEVIGQENPVPILEKCRGKGDETCCRWLMHGDTGDICGRLDPTFSNALIFNTSAYKKEPLKMFPACMDE